jgi:uncharacterized SAM-binding protein YcdF (DUF218 family)
MVVPDAKTAPVRLPKMRWRRGVVVLVIVVLVLGLAWLERAPILQHIGAWWVVSDELTKADAVVVLGGDVDARPFAAADLYKRGFAGTILVSNAQMGRAERLGFIPSYAELARAVLVKLGVPGTAIIPFGQDLSSTQEEAAAVRQWAVNSHAKRIIVPTEIFAARRTRWVFDRELSPIGVQVIVHAFQPPYYTIANWWQHRYGLVDFNNEVLKYLYYRVEF